MNELFEYFLESGISLALFYAVYWIFLKKETFFSVNRFYLIFSVVFSLLIPFLRIPSPFLVTRIVDSSQSLERMTPLLRSTQSMGFTNYFWLIYLLGAGILFLRFTFQLLQLFYLVKKYGVEKVKGLHFVFTKRHFSDFTFFQLIFIDKSKLMEDDLDQIIAHEQIHIKQYHTLDLIFVELLVIFQWFNPFVWLYKRSIKETHEYLADDAVIAQGCDTAKYQLLIFERFVGVRLFDLANSFHQSQIKRRITMMTKHKSKGWAKYKVLLILPVLSFLVLAFAEPRVLIQEKKEEKTVTQVKKVEPVKINKQDNAVVTLGEHKVVEPKAVEVKVDPEIVLAEPDKIVLRQPVIVTHQDLAKVKKEKELQEKEKKLREEKIKLLKKEYEALKKEIEAGGDGEEIKKKKALLEKKMMALKKEEEFIKMKKMEGDGRLYELELAAKFKSERKKLKEMVAKAETEEEKEALMEKMRKLDEKEKAMKEELAKRREMEKKKQLEEKEKSTKKKAIEL